MIFSASPIDTLAQMTKAAQYAYQQQTGIQTPAGAVSDFLTENKTTLLVVGGVLAAGLGFWYYKSRR